MNLVEMLSRQLGGTVAGQIGKSLGIDEKTAQAGVNALIPIILGGLLNQVSKPGGPDQLNQTLGKEDFNGSIFNRLEKMLSGGNTAGLTKMGGDLSSMIFGDKGSLITSALGRLVGMESGKAGSLLSMILPLVISFLGKLMRSGNMDRIALVSLLSSQKDPIAKAMPRGFTDSLGFANLLGDANKATKAMASAAGGNVSSEATGGSFTKLLILGLVLAALGLVLYKYVLTSKSEDNGSANRNVPAAVDGLPKLPEMALPAELKELTGMVDDLKSAFEGISDEASANSALPKLTELADKLDGFERTFGELNEDVKKTAATALSGLFKPLQELIDRVLAVPDVGPVLKPIVDQMMTSLKTLTGQ